MGGACGLGEEEIDGVKKGEEKNYCTWVSVSVFVHVSVCQFTHRPHSKGNILHVEMIVYSRYWFIMASTWSLHVHISSVYTAHKIIKNFVSHKTLQPLIASITFYKSCIHCFPLFWVRVHVYSLDKGTHQLYCLHWFFTLVRKN